MPPRAGQSLRKARIARGIELGEVEQATRIRAKFLRALEEGRWDDLPAPVYTRSFLSSYARFLELEDEALVEEYDRWVESADRAEPIPPQAVQRGAIRSRRPIKPLALLLGSLLAAGVVLGLLIAALGGSGDGGEQVDRRQPTAADSATSETTTAPAGEVSVELRTTAAVWVCLVDDRERAVVNGVTLVANQTVGPYTGRGFSVTFGNGSVEMTVDGVPAEIPPLAEPVGYRINASGVRELEPAEQPSCL
jgi:cytoskeleton protein RodZ